MKDLKGYVSIYCNNNYIITSPNFYCTCENNAE